VVDPRARFRGPLRDPAGTATPIAKGRRHRPGRRCCIRWGSIFFALDLPAHGESDYRPISFGFWERHLLGQVIDQLRAERPEETRTLALMA